MCSKKIHPIAETDGILTHALPQGTIRHNVCAGMRYTHAHTHTHTAGHSLQFSE